LKAHGASISVSKYYTPFWDKLHTTVYFVFNAPNTLSSGDIQLSLTGMTVPEIAAPTTDAINLVIYNGEKGA